MKEDGKWFTDKELQACCNLYNISIVVFSVSNKMKYMDSLIVSS